jgi:putative transposase
MVKPPKPPSPTWRTFLENHGRQLVLADFLVATTVSFRIRYVLFVLAHERKRVVHFNVTEHPTGTWTTEQLVQVFPWHTAPRYLLRDRDRTYGEAFPDSGGEHEDRAKCSRLLVLPGRHPTWRG